MPGPYDPNGEGANEETVVAGHWELLRRNKTFRAVSERWLQSETFRQSHGLSPDYHDLQHHTPRCAWDWMLTPSQRVRLAKFQIKHLSWFFDARFNFGPLLTRENFPAARVSRTNWRTLFDVAPLPNAPDPLTIGQAWNRTPEIFKQQFRLAYGPPDGFGEANSWLQENGTLLARAASRIATGDPQNESQAIADALWTLGSELRDLAEFYKVFTIPRSPLPENRFNHFLAQIRENFRAAGLLVPTKKYGLHKSYLGTAEDWRWFLEAERLGLDIRQSADLYKLAAIYCEDLRQRAMRGNAPRRAKGHGFSGSKISSKLIKNRRSTVKRHVLSIEGWIQKVYPLRRSEQAASAS